MNEEDLDKTKPIATLNEITLEPKEPEPEEDESRSEKYKDALIKEEVKNLEEEAEEALAEKNIAMAEKILEEDKEKKEEKDNLEKQEEVKKEKLNLIIKIKRKWNNLSSKQKTIFLVIIAIIFVALISLLLFLALKPKEETKPKEEEKVDEVVPIIIDNYYYKNGELHFTDENKKELGTYKCENKDDGLCYVGYNSNNDSFDVQQLLDENNKELVQRLPIYEENYVFVFDNKNENDSNIKLYSIKDEKVVEEYNEVKAYADNYIVVKNTNNEYGLIRLENGITQIIKPQYLYLGMIDKENNLIARNSKGYIVINKNNKVLSSVFNSTYEIKSYNDNFVIAKVANEYSAYNYKAELIDTGYDYITANDKYIALVDNYKVYVKDINGLKYNEIAVNLKNKDYIKTYIYDKDGNLKEIKRSFSLDKNDEEVIIAVYEEDSNEAVYTNLNILTAEANKKYNYVNYFDSKLFFYRDANKTDLIGYYTCANENIIKNKDEEYTSCFVATDTIYEDNDMVTEQELNRKSRIPLINERYVFVADGTNNVSLFDLVEQKTLSSYASVNTYTENNDNKFASLSTNKEIKIIALNKKGKYGMIGIEGDKVSTKSKFDYNKMEKIGDYTLALNTSNKWIIILDDGYETEGFPGKIRGYSSNTKYFKVIINGKYNVYNEEVENIGNGSYSYVDLHEDYFAGIDDENMLNIYDYEGNKLTTSGIKIGDYPYYKTANPAFKVRKTSIGYIVSVYNGSTYEEHNIKTNLPTEDNDDDSDEDSENQES